MIHQAKHPLLLIGAGSNRKDVRASVCEFVKSTGIYFFNTQMGKGCVNEHLDQFIGTAAWLFFIINVFKLPFHIFIWKTVTLESLVLNKLHLS